MKKPKGFNKMVDAVVMHAQEDPELQEGIAYLDQEATKQGISFYDMMYMVMIKHNKDDN